MLEYSPDWLVFLPTWSKTYQTIATMIYSTTWYIDMAEGKFRELLSQNELLVSLWDTWCGSGRFWGGYGSTAILEEYLEFESSWENKTLSMEVLYKFSSYQRKFVQKDYTHRFFVSSVFQGVQKCTTCYMGLWKGSAGVDSRFWLGGQVCNRTRFLPRVDPMGAVKATSSTAVCNHSVVNLAPLEQVSPSAEQFAFE